MKDINIGNICLILVLMPLLASILSGFFRKAVGRAGAHSITILGVTISFICAIYLAKMFLVDGHSAFNENLYTWGSGGGFFPYSFHVGFLIDQLTTVMLLVVTFVSLAVHIYSMGYMADDDGYQRFFSYISLFTFAMLMLVSANNFLQLFFGWEGVGLVSYLLIGFWFQKESALQGSMKAFLVNRVGDFGFILGIGLVLSFAGTLDYAQVFAKVPELSQQSITLFDGHAWSLITVICILLFIGAMGKSAQIPLHVWLPESMEGPTPISALIHAATMVTAGVFMVARMSPLFEQSNTALAVITIIGATGALFTGLLGVVMNDIKRVVAYSTLSQLGYMMVAMGVSAYPVGIFHLGTHACFKALLFLAAGSVIIGMHHEQDMRKMGGLWRFMPITYVTFLIGSLALCAIPPFAGFYSKDMIIDAAKLATVPGATYAYYCVFLGAFVTALYTFRALFMTFHGKPRMDAHTREHLHESPWSVCLPLILLAIPSVCIGYLMFPEFLSAHGLLGSSVTISPSHTGWYHLIEEVGSANAMTLDAVLTPTFWLVIAGIATAWVFYILKPEWPAVMASKFSWIYRILLQKFGFDLFNEKVLEPLTRGLGSFFYKVGDQKLIDGFFVNGSARVIEWSAVCGRKMQSGYIYHYATAMIFGLLGLLAWLLLS
jgi:NADH-quinone oxidoreductase subunit L